MTIFELAILLAGCLGITGDIESCSVAQPVHAAQSDAGQVAGVKTPLPYKTGEAVDVELSAVSVVVWDVDSGETMYEKNAYEKRPIASLSKLLAALVVKEGMQLDQEVEITDVVKEAQAKGVDVSLPVGEHVTAGDLLAAGMIASANDAMVALAESYSGSEAAFAHDATIYAKSIGVNDTKLANATGLTGGEQFSTANDVRKMISAAYGDNDLRALLSSSNGTLLTREGTVRKYVTTNDLVKSYLPILAAKTGYTYEAGENLAVITRDDNGHKIGAVVLGSSDRFYDMKVLVEWVWRNFEWR